MQVLKSTSLTIPDNRQRQEFDPIAIMELVESIKTKGLMHPIVYRKEGGAKILVAGEHRMRALQMMWELGYEVRCDGSTIAPENYPCTSLGDLPPLLAREAELEENTRRRDLTWQERAKAEAELHALRVDQAAERGETHTIADTAKEVRGRGDGSYQNAVRQNVIIAKHLDNPAVAKAATASEAMKILRKEDVTRRNADLAASVGETLTGASHTLVNVDCIKWMAEQPAEQFDVILTDPPYGMGADVFGDGGGLLSGTEHTYDDSPAAWANLMRDWCPQAFRLAKPQAHAYVFCDLDRFHELKALMAIAGWYVFRTPLIVHKINSGRVPLPEYGPRRCWEMCLYAIKGNKPVTHIYPDVIPCQGDDNPVHGAQKPVVLFHNLLMRSVKPGDKVLDTFAGAGPIIDAAHQHKCFATAVELNPALYGACVKRVQAIDNPNGLEV